LKSLKMLYYFVSSEVAINNFFLQGIHMYTLFWEKGSGSIVVQALLEEMGVSYEPRHVDMASGEHKGRDYLQQNPTGLVPALGLPNKQTIGESAAIVLHLGEQGADNPLVPQPGDADRPEFLYWSMYMATIGYPAFTRIAHPERYTKDQDAIDPVRLAAEDAATMLLDVLEDAIKGRPYFLSSGFSALDLYLTMLSEWHPDKSALFKRNPKIALLCLEVKKRPAYKKAITDHS
jgi:glutathione S-transferase